MELQRNLWRSFLKVGMYKYASEGVAFIGSIFISRVLDPTEYGVVAMIAVGYLFVARFSNPGYTESIVREQDSVTYKSELQWVFVFHGLILALIMLFLAFPISWFFQDPRLIYPSMLYALILFLYALPGASESFLSKKKRFKAIFKVELLGTVISVGITIWLAYRGFSYWSLILPHVVIPLIYLGFYHYWEPIPWSRPQVTKLRSVFRKMRSLVWQLSKVNVVEYWEEQTDNFWVGRLYGGGLLGVYNRAYLVTHLPRALFKPLVNAVLLPEWQQYQNEHQKVSSAYISLIQMALALVAIPMTLVLLIPEKLTVWLWGDQWLGVAPFIAILGVVMGFQVVCSSGRAVFLLMHQEKLFTRYAWWQGVFLILVLSVTAFISMQTMVHSLVLVVLIVKVPAFCYWCLNQSLGVGTKRIARTLGPPWLLSLTFWTLSVLNNNDLLIFPLAILWCWALTIVYTNRRLLL